MLRPLKQTGDTIIEVLIATAVIGAVIVGAFVSTNQSLKTNQQALEHSTALKIAESQLELIKSASANRNSNIYTTFVSFCMQATPLLRAVPPACTVTNGVDYQVDVKLTNVTPPQYKYTVNVDWDSIINGQDHVSLVYKVDRP